MRIMSSTTLNTGHFLFALTKLARTPSKPFLALSDQLQPNLPGLIRPAPSFLEAANFHSQFFDNLDTKEMGFSLNNISKLVTLFDGAPCPASLTLFLTFALELWPRWMILIASGFDQ